MKDLNEFLLKEAVAEAPTCADERGVVYIMIPRDVATRVTDTFDVEHVRAELRGPRYRQ